MYNTNKGELKMNTRKIRTRELTNIEIIKELKKLFDNDPIVHQKLKIIESNLEPILKSDSIDCSLPYKHLKPSRIQSIINAFEENHDAGYIQPIGKKLFLNRFLKKYPSPRFVHLGEEEWTIDLLNEYLHNKYYCSITHDTLRKELTTLKKRFKASNTTIEALYQKNLLTLIEKSRKRHYIYFYQLYNTPYPFKKSTNATHNNRKSCFLGCIYGIPPTGNVVSYKSNPYFQLSANYETHIPNLHYYFDLPINPGLILIEDTADSRKIIKDYYYWFFSKKNSLPKYHLYFIPNDMYVRSPLLDACDSFSLLTKRPLLNYGIDGIKALKANADSESIGKFFDYDVIRKNNTSCLEEPKLLKKSSIKNPLRQS